MTIDVRREAREIWKHFGRYQETIGEWVLWFKFDVLNSQYDRVYDEGFRRYLPGLKVRILWIDQMEAAEGYAPEGRRPTQRFHFAVSARELYEAGISVTEASGNRVGDISPSTIWRLDRVNDIVFYDGRYYEVSDFQIRGRVKTEDVIIGVSGIEVYPSDDMILDVQPGATL
jgi:hypothetical protein